MKRTEQEASDRPQGNAGRVRRVLPVAVVALAACVVLAAGLRNDQAPRYEGEFGLAVHFQDDSVVVRWLTAEAHPGHLEVLRVDGGQAVARGTTAPGFAHRVAFPRPADDPDLLLRYGSEGSDGSGGNRFETRISLRPPERPPVSLEAVDSIFVLGDTHGWYDEFLTGMGRAGLIDEEGRWSGGRRHVVLAGDLMDRGPDVAALLWTTYRLEREAAEAGGRVHVLLGNHEIMVMLGDLRYVHPKEADVANWHSLPYDRLYDLRHSLLGRWLGSKPAVVRIGGAVIMHGGLTSDDARLGLHALDDSLRSFMAEDLFYQWADTTFAVDIDSVGFVRRFDFFQGPESVFWHRGYVQSDTLEAELSAVLTAIDGSLLVLGHTPVDSIHQRYHGRVVVAHTPRFGSELFLLVREGADYRRYRVTEAGFELLATPAPAGSAHP